jgi:hypothetical protein
MVAQKGKSTRRPTPSSHLLQPESPMQDALANGVMCGWKVRNEINDVLASDRGIGSAFASTIGEGRLLYGTDRPERRSINTYDELGDLDLRVPESAEQWDSNFAPAVGKKILAFWIAPRPRGTRGPLREAVLVWDNTDIMDCGIVQGPGEEILPPELYRKLLDTGRYG